MGHSGTIRDLFPVIFPEDEMPGDLPKSCQEAVEERDNVVHDGQRRDYRYTITEEAVRGGEPLVVDTWFGSQVSPAQPKNPAAPLRHRLGRRSAGGS
jgi:hypothetical protein